MTKKKEHPVAKNLRQQFEDVLPKYLVAMTVSKMMETGLELREDIMESVVTGFEAALPKDPVQRAQIIQKLEKTTPGMLREIEADNAQTALIGVCSWLVKMIDERLIADTGSVASLSALMFIEEARDDAQTWQVMWEQVNSTVPKLMNHCQLGLGLYLKEAA